MYGLRLSDRHPALAINAERFRRIPELGPNLLFFSGGTAMRDTARVLTQYTHNAVHIMTPFDSGGSSAALRKAFNMPAVGDIRARIMALADQSVKGNPETCALFAYRFPREETRKKLLRELGALCEGSHALLRDVPGPLRKIIRNTLLEFHQRMPGDFPLEGASVGNLILAGGYLSRKRRLAPVISLYSRMVRARGTVLPVADENAHLAVRLESGDVLVGQHTFTGKGTAPVRSPIRDIWLTSSLDDASPIQLRARAGLGKIIRAARLICYPFGSFYSSLIANLLPGGVGRAIGDTPCPKVYIPNLGLDPELAGHSLKDQVSALLGHLRNDDRKLRPQDVLSLLLLHKDDDAYAGGVPRRWLAGQGIRAVRAPLITPESFPYACPRLVAGALVSLAWNEIG
jgi:CofD-related protein of GAK system